jgi:hypothetical protein
MMNRIKIILPLFLMAALPVAAQKLVAIKADVDAGKTGYMQPVTAVFEFRNKSHSKLRIERVVPDCRCTTIEYPKNEVGSNEKFEVRMTYDARQLGHFDKQAAIVSNGSSKPFYIRMKGVVLADLQDFSGSYPIEMGDLRLDKADLEFDDVNRGDQQVQELHIYNNGTKVYHPNLMHLPSYLTAVVTPERLGPGRSGKITVVLNSALLRDYGLTQTSVYLAGNPGDKVSPDHEIGVSAVLLPSFDGIALDKSQAPKMQLSKNQVDIQFDGKSKKSDVIIVTNTGGAPLNITSLQLFTGGLKVSLGKRNLNPGETTKLKITAMREDLSKVRTRPRILMITNDPSNPKITITINAK